ncbi:MAG: hypothetical protein LBR32_09350 [Propionibacteriaceae bacterium]|jgi:hypothetical protein|nr:hypothetical protein [Propionibacteriaceae bacterium]
MAKDNELALHLSERELSVVDQALALVETDAEDEAAESPKARKVLLLIRQTRAKIAEVRPADAQVVEIDWYR